MRRENIFKNEIKWIDCKPSNKNEALEILKEFDFHELDIEWVVQKNQRSRIDNYKDYSFIVLYFPKYIYTTKKYSLNEFNIFISKKFIITFKGLTTSHIDTLFKDYENNLDGNISSGTILYEIIENMQEKIFKAIEKIQRDLIEIEEDVFKSPKTNLLKQIMTKKRNIISLKHSMLPQISTLKQLETKMNTMFQGELEVYFEDLIDKMEHIVNNVKILEEHIENILDVLKTTLELRTSYIIRILTIFSSLMLPLTLVTSFYGMNIELPFQDSPITIYIVFLITFLIIFFTLNYVFLRKDK